MQGRDSNETRVVCNIWPFASASEPSSNQRMEGGQPTSSMSFQEYLTRCSHNGDHATLAVFTRSACIPSTTVQPPIAGLRPAGPVGAVGQAQGQRHADRRPSSPPATHVQDLTLLHDREITDDEVRTWPPDQS